MCYSKGSFGLKTSYVGISYTEINYDGISYDGISYLVLFLIDCLICFIENNLQCIISMKLFVYKILLYIF